MKHTFSTKKIGKRIKALRKQKTKISGEPVWKVAGALGISPQFLYLVEAGERQLTEPRIEKFARYFNVPVASIIGEQKRKSA